jgi:transposase
MAVQRLVVTERNLLNAWLNCSIAIDVKIRLIYYPPYPSKYNPIERCWAALENYWNGTILDSVEAVIQWAANMTWKGIAPIVHRVETIRQMPT